MTLVEEVERFARRMRQQGHRPEAIHEALLEVQAHWEKPLDVSDILSVQQLSEGDRLFLNGAVVTITAIHRAGTNVTVKVQPEEAVEETAP